MPCRALLHPVFLALPTGAQLLRLLRMAPILGRLIRLPQAQVRQSERGLARHSQRLSRCSARSLRIPSGMEATKLCLRLAKEASRPEGRRDSALLSGRSLGLSVQVRPPRRRPLQVSCLCQG